ncbi:putative F-box protein PP2-B12 isoform X6 [Gossypium hirsutum]|uniref:F-box protein PP2-B12 isoform X6 n=1 Tax=Gossypium hirsutum TaxID=3635 RepID=A0ABM3ATS1_GOSHI|nr:putative F-box protein PP2-B12 isoform X6 [Gossypium hirsutum]
MEITKVLPDDCISLIISLTSPRDACRMALLSHAFNSIADSNAVWQMFLPLDYIHIISNSSSPPSLLSLPKKDLYFTLCYHPILTHNGDMFQLEKESGKKWYMVGARALSIQWVDTPRHWTWISLPDSRHTPVELDVSIEGTAAGEVRSVILDPPRNMPQQAKERVDGWLEIEMGEFFNGFENDRTVEFSLREDHDDQPKRGLIVQGIELRPKHKNNR